MHLPAFILALLARYDIDARRLVTLVGVYLKQDLRGGRAFMQFNTREYVRGNFALLALLGMYIFFGCIMGMVVFVGMDVFHYALLIHTFTLCVVALAMLAESGNVIFNEKEADILGHLPISPRTYFVAKVLNLFLFTLLLATSANLFPAVFGLQAPDANILIIPAQLLGAFLVALFATTLVVASYGLLMRWVSRERFDSIVAYSQIILVLFFMFGFQILPRVMDANFTRLTQGFRDYYYFYPPAWFAGVTVMATGKLQSQAVLLSAIGITTLVALGVLAIHKVGSDYSSFVSKLAYREITSRPVTNKATGQRQKSQGGLLATLKSLLLARSAERAAFDLVSTYLRRNREVKVRLYPTLAYFIFIPFLAVFTDSLPDPFLPRHFESYPLMGALMICYVALTAIEVLLFSEHYGAADIFRVAPIARLGDVHSGFRKAVMVWVALPGFTILFLLYAIIWRNPLHAGLLLVPWIIITPAILMLGFLFREALPLSRKYQKGQQTSRNVLLFVACFALLALFGGLQSMGMKGRLPIINVVFPYWLFLILSLCISAFFYYTLRALSREARGIQPSDLNG